MLLLHIGAGYAVWKLFFGSGFSAAAWIMFGLTWAANVLFTTVVYHRYLTHKAFMVKSAKLTKAMYAGTTITFQGSVRDWGETHWRHHVYADVDGDPHRPSEFGGGLKGFLWAHMGWIFFELAPAPSPEYRPSPHFREDAALDWQAKYYLPLAIALGFGVPFLVAGWNGLLLAGFLRTVLCLHLTWGVNSLCHVIGALAEDSKGNPLETRRARNFPLHCLLNILAFLSGGEYWHANHHARPRSALLGWNWSQLDPGGWVIRLGEKLGLFQNVEQPNV
jgi:stearoyl-CoA desaturase (delta-9 desaturase)